MKLLPVRNLLNNNFLNNNKKLKSNAHLAQVHLLFQQTLILMKTSWSCLEDVFHLRCQRTSSNVLNKTLIFTWVIGPQKTSSRRFYDVLIKTNIFVLVICLEDVFKTFSRRLQDGLSRLLRNFFTTSSRGFQDISSS